VSDIVCKVHEVSSCTICLSQMIKCKRGTVTVTEGVDRWLIEGAHPGKAPTYRLCIPRCDCDVREAKRLNRPVEICPCNTTTVKDATAYPGEARHYQCRKRQHHCWANGHASKVERLVNEVVGTYGGAR